MKLAESSPNGHKTVGKGEIAQYEQFLFFPVFLKDLYSRHVKTRACLGKGQGAKTGLILLYQGCFNHSV